MKTQRTSVSDRILLIRGCSFFCFRFGYCLVTEEFGLNSLRLLWSRSRPQEVDLLQKCNAAATLHFPPVIEFVSVRMHTPIPCDLKYMLCDPHREENRSSSIPTSLKVAMKLSRNSPFQPRLIGRLGWDALHTSDIKGC
jgi:hypothetical protein